MNKIAKSKKLIKLKKTKLAKVKNLIYLGLGVLISKAREFFIKLNLLFIEILLFNYFDLKYYIHIKTDISSYIIGKIIY